MEKEEMVQDLSLTIEYKEKATGLKFVRFDAVENENRISLWCHNDDSGKRDVVVSPEELEANYIEVKRYMED